MKKAGEFTFPRPLTTKTQHKPARMETPDEDLWNEVQVNGPSRWRSITSGYDGGVVTGWRTWYREFEAPVVVSRDIFLTCSRVGSMIKALLQFLNLMLERVINTSSPIRLRNGVKRMTESAISRVKNLERRTEATRRSTGTQTEEPIWRAMEKARPLGPPIRTREPFRIPKATLRAPIPKTSLMGIRTMGGYPKQPNFPPPRMVRSRSPVPRAKWAAEDV